jgi:ribosome-associated protein
VSPSRSRNQTELDEEDYGPSRTQQRRDALAVLTLASQLVDMQPSRLAKLDLPDDVRDEITRTRSITAHIARKRQLAFLAKVMRRYEDEIFASVRAELGENREKQRQETAAMHRLESMRDRLIAEDEGALSELITEHPQVDRQHLRSLIRQARSEKETPNKPPRAYREIFQLLKELGQIDTDMPTPPEA